MKVRMSWDFVGDWPIIIYTTWLDHNLFRVKLIKGTKGDQNAGNTGPKDPAWKTYEIRGFSSKDAVVEHALKQAQRWLEEGH